MPRHSTAPFWAQVQRTPSCWLWIGRVNNKGYGMFKSTLAHRWSFAQVNGPIPPGLCVLHRCDTPRCVRPDHLFGGSKADNTHDMMRKGRQRPPPRNPHLTGVRTPAARLTADAVRRARAWVGAGWSHGAVARGIGVDRSVVTRLVHRQTYRDVD